MKNDVMWSSNKMDWSTPQDSLTSFPSDEVAV